MKKQRGLQIQVPAFIFMVVIVSYIVFSVGNSAYIRYTELTENEQKYFQSLNEKEDIKLLQSKISNLQNEIQKEKQTTSTFEKGIEEKEKELKAFEKKYQKRIEDITLLKGEIDTLHKENERFAKRISELEKQLSNLKSNQIANSSTKTEKVKNKNEENKNKSNSNEKIAYLTFDDGPSKNTSEILDILSEYGIKATFFPIGNNSKTSEEIYKRIVDEGHSIGNHTYSHDYNYIYSSVDNFKKDLFKLENYLLDITGVSPKIIRFPGGSNNKVSIKSGGKEVMQDIVNETGSMGYVHFDWNVDSTDAIVQKQDKDKIVTSVLDGSKNKTNAIILFHDSSPKTTTVNALKEIIDGLKEQGFSFEALTTESKAVQFTKTKQ